MTIELLTAYASFKPYAEPAIFTVVCLWLAFTYTLCSK